MRRSIWVIGIIIVILGIATATAAAFGAFHHHTTQLTLKPVIRHTTTRPASPSFNKQQFSLTDPTSLWVIVNKQHPLSPLNFAPASLRYPAVALHTPGQPSMELRDDTATALEQLFAAATAAGFKLQVLSGYRSYSYQVGLYNSYVTSVGQAAADQESARPGYSEHQTGLAVDIGTQDNRCNLEACFGDTSAGQWLAANAYQYGFLLRYPANKVAVTGYEYEPWHFRYVGQTLSQQLHSSNTETLEEFFNVTGGTTYSP